LQWPAICHDGLHKINKNEKEHIEMALNKRCRGARITHADIERWLAVWNSHNPDSIDALFSDNVLVSGTMQGTFTDPVTGQVLPPNGKHFVYEAAKRISYNPDHSIREVHIILDELLMSRQLDLPLK
jgi:hypothetical protein